MELLRGQDISNVQTPFQCLLSPLELLLEKNFQDSWLPLVQLSCFKMKNHLKKKSKQKVKSPRIFQKGRAEILYPKKEWKIIASECHSIKFFNLYWAWEYRISLSVILYIYHQDFVGLFSFCLFDSFLFFFFSFFNRIGISYCFWWIRVARRCKQILDLEYRKIFNLWSGSCKTLVPHK